MDKGLQEIRSEIIKLETADALSSPKWMDVAFAFIYGIYVGVVISKIIGF